MEYMALWFILGIFFLVTAAAPGIRLWVKTVIVGYYLVLSFIFITRKEEIYEQYHTLPVPEKFWDLNSEWVETLIGYYFLPFLLIVLYIYCRWFVRTKETVKRVFILLSLIPAGIVFFCLLMIFGMYGYRP